MSATSSGPHGRIAVDDARGQFALELFDRLWDRYRERVSHVGTYEKVIAEAGAAFVNDHIAFRTLACQDPQTGIASISRVFEALGYQPAGCYHFADKHLNAIHYQYPHPDFPKLFISELRTWELAADVSELIARTVATHRPPLPAETLSELVRLDRDSSNRDQLLETVVAQFHELPWQCPERADVEAANAASQYAAWVLVHGYHVNHFTSLINSHATAALDDIDKTISALRAAGVPMKAEVEGAPGSKLRQSATEAAVIDVTVREHGRESHIPWTYAYFELAERGNITDPETGQSARFEGFLGPQATHLFEMTRLKG